MSKYTKHQTRQYIRDNSEQLAKNYGCSLLSIPLLAAISLALFIAWGFGADRMLYVGIGVAVLTLLLLLQLRRTVRRDVKLRMDRGAAQ